jgi:phosphate transport system substrate-binding protein
MLRSVRFSILTSAIAAVILAACAPAPAPTEAPAAPTEAAMPTSAPAADPMAMYMPDAVTGQIVTAGSSTVFPLSERMKQRFEEEGFAGQITVDSIGSGAGLERFCVAGETDIANSSRKIKDSEVEACNGIGREPVEFQVGIDALAVAVSAENTFMTDVTLEELAAIFSTAQKWSDVRAEWPAEDILRFSPGTDSGTFDYFVEAVMAPAYKNAEGKADVALGEAAILDAANIQLSEDDNVLVEGVLGSPYAVGYFGYAYYKENASALTAVSVNGVAPTEATAESSEYPISRPLFIYSDASIMTEKPQVAAFIYFYITNVADEILDVGYFPTSGAKVEENIEAWKTASGM